MKTDERNEIMKISANDGIYIFRVKMCANKEIRNKLREDIIRQAKDGIVLLNEYIELVEEIRPTRLTEEDIDTISETTAKRLVEAMNQLDNH